VQNVMLTTRRSIKESIPMGNNNGNNTFLSP